MIKYRVKIRVAYYEAYFDFDNYMDAGSFATDAIKHMVPSDDQEKVSYVGIDVINDDENEEEE